MKQLVTPERARGLLSRPAPEQQPLLLEIAVRYAGEMRAGTFVDQGGVIALDEEGRLVNGQHRLLGVVLAGVPVLLSLEAPCRARWHTLDSLDSYERCVLSHGHDGPHQRAGVA